METTPMPEQPGFPSSATIRLHPLDNVVIARAQLVSGTALPAENIVVSGLIPPGHKIATDPIKEGAPVRRYGQIIGFAAQDIKAGQHVHTHNLKMGVFAREHSFCVDAKPTKLIDAPATFMGILRPDGRVATRNYIGVLTSVNCSATAARAIADHFRRDINPQALAAYPNVALKWAHAPAFLSTAPYPFPDLEPKLARALAALFLRDLRCVAVPAELVLVLVLAAFADADVDVVVDVAAHQLVRPTAAATATLSAATTIAFWSAIAHANAAPRRAALNGGARCALNDARPVAPMRRARCRA